MAVQTLFGRVVALKTPRNLTCNGCFCKVLGCKTLTSKNWALAGGFAWKYDKEHSGKSQCFKVNRKGKNPHIFS